MSDRFEASWLDCRRAADHAARSEPLFERLRDAGRATSHRLVDLGAGTGSNLVWLAPRLGGNQDWLLVDADRDLLVRLPATLEPLARQLSGELLVEADGMLLRGPGFRWRIQARCLDLATGLGALALPADAIVTGSALLDLVSEAWLEELAWRCRAARARMLFTLSVDGRVDLQPALPMDAPVLALFAAHQRRDKGLGLALGSGAADGFRRVFEDAGFATAAAASDWLLDGRHGELQQRLIDGWRQAAIEQARQATAPAARRSASGDGGNRDVDVRAGTSRAAREAVRGVIAGAAIANSTVHEEAIAGWSARRLALIDTGQSRIRVGHQDQIAWLP